MDQQAFGKLFTQWYISAQQGDNAGGAMALKSRVLLFAASDLFHNVSEWAGGFSEPELVGYVNADQNVMWQEARDAARDVMDLGIYDLFRANPTPGDSTAQNFVDLFLINQHEEAIFSSFFFSEQDYEWYEVGMPCDLSSASQSNPTRLLKSSSFNSFICSPKISSMIK